MFSAIGEGRDSINFQEQPEVTAESLEKNAK